MTKILISLFAVFFFIFPQEESKSMDTFNINMDDGKHETYEINKVFVTAPARFPDSNGLNAGVYNLKMHDLEVVIGDSCIRTLSDEEKAQEINMAYADDSIDAILCARGGHGSMNLLDYLDYDLIAENPKPIVGYSDITALLLGINALSGIVTYHGPMVAVEMMYDGNNSLENLIDTLRGDHEIKFDYPFKTIVSGEMIGKLIVANLSLFETIQGTKYMPSLDNCILILEDTDESRESIERMIWNIQHIEEFQNLRGIIFAGFTDLENGSKNEIEELIYEHFKDSEIPVYIGLPIHHGIFTKISLPLGKWSYINMEDQLIKLFDNVFEIDY